MKRKKSILLVIVIAFAAAGIFLFIKPVKPKEDTCISYIVDPKTAEVQLYWKDDKGNCFKSIQRLKDWLKEKDLRLVFAMNGGMYKTDNSPQGLFIQNRMVLSPADTSTGKGNFYMKPNGIFFITADTIAAIYKTTDFKNDGRVMYATQSGPMLVIDGQVHPAFKKGSANLNIRNGVGILPDHRIVFAMSKQKINFYDFAAWFKNRGCKNALYLDGLVSRTYLPDRAWIQTDGDFGVLIGVSEKGVK